MVLELLARYWIEEGFCVRAVVNVFEWCWLVSPRTEVLVTEIFSGATTRWGVSAWVGAT